MTYSPFSLAPLAAALALAAAPAFAENPAQQHAANHATDHAAHPAPESHAPARLMNEHTHKTGEWMIGYRAERSESSGYRAGDRTLSASEVSHLGYTMGATRMTMDMHMLEVMYALNDRVTLMLMPHYMTMTMDMEALPAAHTDMSMDGGHGGHGTSHGAHSHSTSGMGDTLISASYLVDGVSSAGVIATLGVYLPTGSVGEKNAAGQLTHYDMQLGSGTWDLLASMTYRGQWQRFSYGAQAGVIARLESANASGYRLGDKYQASLWGAYRAAPWLSLSGRVGLVHQDDIEGHYNAAHGHASPMDIQANYGGRYGEIGVGANLVNAAGVRLGLEWSTPFSENYNGVQLGRDDTLSLSLSYAFH